MPLNKFPALDQFEHAVSVQTYQERLAHLLIERGWEELHHVSQLGEERGVEITEVTEHHQQWSQGAVHQLDIRLRVVCHELDKWRGTEHYSRTHIHRTLYM